MESLGCFFFLLILLVKNMYLFSSLPRGCAFLLSHTILIIVAIVEVLIGLNESIVTMRKMIKIYSFFSPNHNRKHQKKRGKNVKLNSTVTL